MIGFGKRNIFTLDQTHPLDNFILMM